MAVITVELPHVGESVTEAVIGKWLVNPGDSVRRYDPLVEVVTDKVSMEVPSPYAGTFVTALVDEGDTTPMGSPIAEMDVEDASTIPAQPSPPTLATEHSGAEEPSGSAVPIASRVGSMIVGANVGPTGGEFTDTSLQSASPDPIGAPVEPSPQRLRSVSRTIRRGTRVSPVVRRLAEENDIDLASVAGTGYDGRISKQDIEAYIASSGNTSRIESHMADEVVEPTAIRRMIADNLARSYREIPHAWGAIEIDVTGLVGYRDSEVERIQSETGIRLTYLHVILWHVARSLRDHRLLNSSWRDGKVHVNGEINIGIAVAAKQGLMVPVVKRADTMTLEQLVLESSRVIEAARHGELKLDDVQGGTFTLNNTGALGSVLGGPIINHPQAAIATTESIVKRPVVVLSPTGDAIAIRSMMNMCLSFDHRVIDGAEAMGFLTDVKERLEALMPTTSV